MGALPAQQLTRLIDSGCIIGATAENISPASLDLSLSAEIYEIQGLVLPQLNEKVSGLLDIMGARQVDIAEPIKCGGLYLAKLRESLDLPQQVYGYCNPKSSTGRLDMHVRVLADGVPRYD